MSWTKRQFVTQAFEVIGLASYIFDARPEDLQSACRQLDAMMGTWNAKGIRVGYPIPLSPENTDLDTETEVKDAANEAIYQNLALRIAPSFGKQISPDLKQSAWYAYQTLLSNATRSDYEMQLPETMPRGQGNKPWRFEGDEFFNRPVDNLQAGKDDNLEFN